VKLGIEENNLRYWPVIPHYQSLRNLSSRKQHTLRS